MTTDVPQDYTYLDWAATAPLCEEAAEAMARFMVPGRANVAFGMNANSLHAPGRAAFEAMELARRQLARDLGCSRPNEVIFTSGATEADNAALFGIARAVADHGRIVTTVIEHEAVLEPARALARAGYDVVFLEPDRKGFITCEALGEALGDGALLVSVQAANSEVGSIQPIAELAALAHSHGALFHTDATQALGKVPMDLGQLGVDAASFSAHKVGGPKGIGALYLKARTPFAAQMLGGGQEDARRSSTQNVCGIAGFAAACHAVVEAGQPEIERQRGLRDALYEHIRRIDGIEPTLDVPKGSSDYLPNIVHAIARDYESETLVLRLDMKGFGVSGGSACSSHSLEPSHVLRAIGLNADQAYGALRISIGRYTTEDDIERFSIALAECLR